MILKLFTLFNWKCLSQGSKPSLPSNYRPHHAQLFHGDWCPECHWSLLNGAAQFISFPHQHLNLPRCSSHIAVNVASCGAWTWTGWTLLTLRSKWKANSGEGQAGPSVNKLGILKGLNYEKLTFFSSLTCLTCWHMLFTGYLTHQVQKSTTFEFPDGLAPSVWLKQVIWISLNFLCHKPT